MVIDNELAARINRVVEKMLAEKSELRSPLITRLSALYAKYSFNKLGRDKRVLSIFEKIHSGIEKQDLTGPLRELVARFITDICRDYLFRSKIDPKAKEKIKEEFEALGEEAFCSSIRLQPYVYEEAPKKMVEHLQNFTEFFKDYNSVVKDLRKKYEEFDSWSGEKRAKKIVRRLRKLLEEEIGYDSVMGSAEEAKEKQKVLVKRFEKLYQDPEMEELLSSIIIGLESLLLEPPFLAALLAGVCELPFEEVKLRDPRKADSKEADSELYEQLGKEMKNLLDQLVILGGTSWGKRWLFGKLPDKVRTEKLGKSPHQFLAKFLAPGRFLQIIPLVQEFLWKEAQEGMVPKFDPSKEWDKEKVEKNWKDVKLEFNRLLDELSKVIAKEKPSWVPRAAFNLVADLNKLMPDLTKNLVALFQEKRVVEMLIYDYLL